MDTDTKATIYDKLSEIANIVVYQQRPEILADLPCVTFYISSNVPLYAVSGEIEHQNIEVTIDIWGNTSSETTLLLAQVVSKMKDLNYLLSFNTDIIDPDDISHLNTRFTY